MSASAITQFPAPTAQRPVAARHPDHWPAAVWLDGREFTERQAAARDRELSWRLSVHSNKRPNAELLRVLEAPTI